MATSFTASGDLAESHKEEETLGKPGQVLFCSTTRPVYGTDLYLPRSEAGMGSWKPLHLPSPLLPDPASPASHPYQEPGFLSTKRPSLSTTKGATMQSWQHLRTWAGYLPSLRRQAASLQIPMWELSSPHAQSIFTMSNSATTTSPSSPSSSNPSTNPTNGTNPSTSTNPSTGISRSITTTSATSNRCSSTTNTTTSMSSTSRFSTQVPTDPSSPGTPSPQASLPVETQAAESYVAVNGLYLGSQIDIEGIARNLGSSRCLELGRDYCIIVLKDKVVGEGKVNEELLPCVPGDYIALFRFGSCVFFQQQEPLKVGGGAQDNEYPASTTQPMDKQNVNRQMISNISAFISDPLKQPQKEEASLVLRPGLGPWYVKEPDRVVLRQLDLGNVEVISRVIGQSVALDYYSRRTSHIRSAEIMVKLCNSGMLYTEVWRSLRREYELEQRLEYLSMKLDPIQDMAKFILDVRRDRTAAARSRGSSSSSSCNQPGRGKIIILLIAAEIAIPLVNHSPVSLGAANDRTAAAGAAAANKKLVILLIAAEIAIALVNHAPVSLGAANDRTAAAAAASKKLVILLIAAEIAIALIAIALVNHAPVSLGAADDRTAAAAAASKKLVILLIPAEIAIALIAIVLVNHAPASLGAADDGAAAAARKKLVTCLIPAEIAIALVNHAPPSLGA
eukprot:gene24565-10176_t